jgi:hypothetical protein
MRRAVFDRLRGFPEAPLMEDVLISLQLRRMGRLAVLPHQIFVSARRWQNRGIVRQSLTNWGLTAAAAVGVPLQVLARFYPEAR